MTRSFNSSLLKNSSVMPASFKSFQSFFIPIKALTLDTESLQGEGSLAVFHGSDWLNLQETWKISLVELNESREWGPQKLFGWMYGWFIWLNNAFCFTCTATAPALGSSSTILGQWFETHVIFYSFSEMLVEAETMSELALNTTWNEFGHYSLKNSSSIWPVLSSTRLLANVVMTGISFFRMANRESSNMTVSMSIASSAIRSFWGR